MKSFLLILSAFILSISNSSAQAYLLDESYKDPDFLAFKIQFVKALIEEDIEAIKDMTAEEITASQDPSHQAKKGFIIDFLTRPKDAKQFCQDALKLISFGFREIAPTQYDMEKGYTKIFYAPSFHRDFDYCYGGNKSTCSKTLVLGDKVNVRAKPTIKSKVLTQLSYEVLEFKGTIDDPWQPKVRENTTSLPEGKYWYEVKLGDGRIGYIIEDYISDNYFIDLRIAKTKNGWKLVSYFIPYRC